MDHNYRSREGIWAGARPPPVATLNAAELMLSHITLVTCRNVSAGFERGEVSEPRDRAEAWARRHGKGPLDPGPDNISWATGRGWSFWDAASIAGMPRKGEGQEPAGEEEQEKRLCAESRCRGRGWELGTSTTDAQTRGPALSHASFREAVERYLVRNPGWDDAPLYTRFQHRSHRD
jgi:hypothetical protein